VLREWELKGINKKTKEKKKRNFKIIGTPFQKRDLPHN
jgi:hypothetical protein